MISVFIASHRYNQAYLEDAIRSVQAQTYQDWELIVGTAYPYMGQKFRADHRVHCYWLPTISNGVGAGKAAVVERCEGEILVELDHDDLLTPDCLEEVAQAFQSHPKASLVYSRWNHINHDGTINTMRFSEAQGWVWDEDTQSHNILPPTPHNVSLIWFAPNHVRAFNAEMYCQVGGYDPALKILDDEDLMSKLYQVGEFIPIDKVLYQQRLHADNTQRDPHANAQIQAETPERYDRTLWANAKAWALRNGLRALENPTQDQLWRSYKNGPDGQAGVIWSDRQLHRHGSEWLRDVYDALAPDGLVIGTVPSTDGRGAFSDPKTKSYWNELSFAYWDKEFQIARVYTYTPTIEHLESNVPIVQFILIKRGKYRHGGIEHVDVIR